MVKWTGHSLVQLRHIHDYIAQDSPLYAKRVSDALVRKTSLLDELPRLGRKVPEFGEENVRELSLYSYRILYEIKTTHIDILAAFTRDGICRGRFRESRSAARKPKPDFDFIAMFSLLHYLEKYQDSRRGHSVEMQ